MTFYSRRDINPASWAGLHHPTLFGHWRAGGQMRRRAALVNAIATLVGYLWDCGVLPPEQWDLEPRWLGCVYCVWACVCAAVARRSRTGKPVRFSSRKTWHFPKTSLLNQQEITNCAFQPYTESAALWTASTTPASPVTITTLKPIATSKMTSLCSQIRLPPL